MLRVPSDPNTAVGEPTGESDDELASVLADPHCRYVVEYLRDHEERVTVEAVATYVAAQLTGTALDDVPTAVQRRVQTWLHHGQLPALDGHGVVTFDPESGTVGRGATPERR